jgi:hypothetical protein
VAATEFLPAKSMSIEPDPSQFSPEVMMGLREQAVFPLLGELKLAGSVSGPFFPTNGARLLVAAIGTDAVTGTTSPYTHTITAANTLPSLTLEENMGGYDSKQYAGCLVNKYEIKVGAGNTEAEITADIMAQSVAVLTSPTALTYTNEAPFVFAEATLDIFGAQVVQVTEVTLTIENQVKDTYTLNNAHTPQYLTPTARKVSGKLTVVFQSLSDSTYGYFNKTIGSSGNAVTGALSLALTHASNSQGVTITCPEISLAKYSDDVKLTDVIISSLDFTGYYDLASTSASVGAVLTNGKSTSY